MFYSSLFKNLEKKISLLFNYKSEIHSTISASTAEAQKLLLENKGICEENKTVLATILDREKSIQRIVSEKSIGFPWLADAISEFHKYQDFEIAHYLETKKHPARKQAEDIRNLAIENKVLRKQKKIAENFVKYYESLFPWIREYVGEDLEHLLSLVGQTKEISEETTDPVQKFITNEQYKNLPSSEKNQLALDRYLVSRKQSQQIGRDYERYVGYQYEMKGYAVEYIGIEMGLEDLGRDLICRKDGKVEIVQCKHWAQYKDIHEKHVNQLYGTAVKFYIEQFQNSGKENQLFLFPEVFAKGNISAAIYTSTTLSETARKFAAALGIKIHEKKPLERYPMIKCNVSPKFEKIYHLPFDQQYDRTTVKNKGEFYAMTVKEAEEKGFRRAFKWKGDKV
ncbi:restriction endonuclease [Dyadobacter arcticus]|uniref:Restriction endonuclease n=1 Tax=Dyadobacter arcticus TaxID=1078754 RepID=A0ABX0UGP9_9BACT|nr:restriction endonuclease [Dyadobacter arcticus]NIJ52188.1 hypothetical protein [Dyadobacter arcticus]